MSNKYRIRDRSPMNSSWVWKKKLARFLVAACFIGTLFIFFGPFSHDTSIEEVIVQTAPSENITVTAHVGCEPDFDVLERLEVKKLSQYVRREVVAVESSNSVPLIQTLDTPLFDRESASKAAPNPTEVLQNDCSIPSSISLQVSRPPQHVDASHFDFGVATNVDRLSDSLDAFAHWAGHTRARIFALVEPDDRIPEVLAKAEQLGVNLIVTHSGEEYQTKYFSLVAHLAENLGEETRWSCIIDDDTFFLSMSALIEAFEKYDHTQQMYVGGVSESVAQIGLFGLMGFGGAGVFLSRPLVERLSEPEVYEACQQSGQQLGYTGDRRISLCVYQYSDAHLTIDHRLRQLDFRGDATGFFEAVRPLPLSVHHWKSWFNADMAKLSKVGEICGETCLLGKWRFSDGWTLTNGFSISKYSSEISPDDTSMELTWVGDHGASLEAFMHELGPLREKDSGKIAYLLVDSVVDEDSVRQWYIHRDSEKGDQIMELIWRRQ
ncbi:glycosyltransferase family 31 protein [Aspergillus lucknowensis]|uniref:Fringe-like glycosyltransferase domain-containing protein n=1 Tax=Aspergillus lucknowensis TaxID=176173 RepID=A0ABR4M278_9EURO